MNLRTTLITLLLVFASFACEVDTMLTSSTSTLNNLDFSHIDPGTRIGIPAGLHPGFRFKNLRGSAEAPVVITNCGGKVIIEEGTYSGIAFEYSSHVRLLGNGDPETDYGIHIRKTKAGVSGISIGKLSHRMEVAFIEISGTGFAGIMAKTDPSCSDSSAWRENFILEGLLIHHNYIHDTGGEGMYIGYTGGFETTKIQCNGVPAFGHLLTDVEIAHNRIERAGWDGIQVSLASERTAIHHNRIIDYGTANELHQNFGLAIGSGTRAEVYANLIARGPQQGISLMGQGGTHVHDNVIAYAGGHGIWAHNRQPDVPLDVGYVFERNTIVKPGRTGIHYNNCVPGGACRDSMSVAFRDNLIVDPGENFENSGFWKGADEAFIDFNSKGLRNSAYADPGAVEGNVFTRSLDSCGFADPANLDFALTEASAFLNVGASPAASEARGIRRAVFSQKRLERSLIQWNGKRLQVDGRQAHP